MVMGVVTTNMGAITNAVMAKEVTASAMNILVVLLAEMKLMTILTKVAKTVNLA